MERIYTNDFPNCTCYHLPSGDYVYDKDCFTHMAEGEATGIKDKTGRGIYENSWLECDCPHRTNHKSFNFVYWDEDTLSWGTVQFSNYSPKQDYKEELFRVKHRNPIVIERPEWITIDRMIAQLKYHSSAWEKKFKMVSSPNEIKKQTL